MPNFSKYDIQSDYLNACFSDLNSMVQKAVERLRPNADRFEAIVVRGVSGLLIGPMAAAILDKPWCVIRKPGEGTHSDFKEIEGWHNFKTYIVVDDLIATGRTLKTIQKTLRQHAKDNDDQWEALPECVGVYLYNCDELTWRGDGKTYSYYDKYFRFQEIPAQPSIADQIVAAVAAGQDYLADAS